MRKNTNDIRHDYVVQLLSGRVDEKGKFTAFKLNPNTPLGDVVRSSNLSTHDVMVKESIWTPHVDIDKECFVKTKKEKAEFKEFKLAHNKLVRSAGFNPKKRLNITAPTTLNV